jgi:hypothetical protein
MAEDPVEDTSTLGGRLSYFSFDVAFSARCSWRKILEDRSSDSQGNTTIASLQYEDSNHGRGQSQSHTDSRSQKRKRDNDYRLGSI